MARKLLLNHQRNSCNQTIIPCSYQSFGCHVRISRGLHNDHHQRSSMDHIQLLANRVILQEEQLSRMTTLNKQLEGKIETESKDVLGLIAKHEVGIKRIEAKDNLPAPSFNLTIIGGADNEREPLKSVYQWNNNQQKWDILPSLPFPQDWCSAARINDCGIVIRPHEGKMPVFGVGEWSYTFAVGAMDMTYGRAVVCNDKLYAIGLNTHLINEYDFEKRKWLSSFPNDTRTSLATISVANKIYIFGGFKGDERVTKCDCYVPLMGLLFPLAPAPRARSYHVAIAIDDDHIWLLGGIGDDRSITDLVEQYTISTNTWETLAWKLPEPRSWFAATFDRSSQTLLIAGGWPKRIMDSVKRRNRDGTWTTLASLPEGRYGCGFY
jgi:hypothetical protein